MYIRSLKECEYSLSNKPETWQDFEKLVRDCAAVKYGREFRLYGRQGQDQHGIDVYSCGEGGKFPQYEYVIQCRDYDSSKSLSYEDMESAYNRAKAHFKYDDGMPKFKHFIFAVSFDSDTHSADNQNRLNDFAAADGVNVDILFWPQIVEIIDNYKIHNDSEEYANGFLKPLFLHRENDRVCLDNLFVMQEYRELDNSGEYGDPKNDLSDRLRRFIGEDGEKMLIIEGDAGSGKTSLAGRLCRDAMKYSDSEDGSLEDAFGGRALITVRLRDLRNRLGNQNYELGPAVLAHMNIKTKRKLEELFPKQLFVLDGFDELCMVQGLSSYENMLLNFIEWLPYDCKAILTSRPRYLDAEILHDKCRIISLQHFSPEKRGEWLDKYKGLFPDEASVGPEIEQYIRSIDDENVSNICDTPLTLYLLTGGRVSIEKTKNIWELYRYIFHDAVSDTEYAKQLDPENGGRHPAARIKEDIYRLTQEIALKMHRSSGERIEAGIERTNDGAFLITRQGIEDAAKRLGKSEVDTSRLIRIHALCCYWRTENSRDYAEFYHNNIRDFFMCERIFAELNEAYGLRGRDDIKKRIAAWFIDNFKHGAPNRTVVDFLKARAEHAVKNDVRNEFPLRERELRLLPELYEYMLLEGTLYDGLGVKNHLRAIENALLGAALVYRSIYEPILKDGERVRWWNDVYAVNESGVFRYVLSDIVGRFGSRADLRAANLIRADLSGAYLRGADLSGAYLSGAVLIGADLRGANLYRADLRLAELSGADLRGADLRGAVLRDGYKSFDQDHQIKYLKSFDIAGLKI